VQLQSMHVSFICRHWILKTIQYLTLFAESRSVLIKSKQVSRGKNEVSTYHRKERELLESGQKVEDCNLCVCRRRCEILKNGGEIDMFEQSFSHCFWTPLQPVSNMIMLTLPFFVTKRKNQTRIMLGYKR
jgi:hypothetical protein